jgi:hypothetical protein
MRITRLHRKVAETYCVKRESAEDVRKQHHISLKTLERWLAAPAFQALLVEIEAKHRRRAKWVFITCSEVVAARLVKLTETDSAETARKACLDVLEHAQPLGETAGVVAAGPSAERVGAERRQAIYAIMAAESAKEAASAPPLPALAPAPPPATVLQPAVRPAAQLPLAFPE